MIFYKSSKNYFETIEYSIVAKLTIHKLVQHNPAAIDIISTMLIFLSPWMGYRHVSQVLYRADSS